MSVKGFFARRTHKGAHRRRSGTIAVAVPLTTKYAARMSYLPGRYVDDRKEVNSAVNSPTVLLGLDRGFARLRRFLASRCIPIGIRGDSGRLAVGDSGSGMALCVGSTDALQSPSDDNQNSQVVG